MRVEEVQGAGLMSAGCGGGGVPFTELLLKTHYLKMEMVPNLSVRLTLRKPKRRCVAVGGWAAPGGLQAAGLWAVGRGLWAGHQDLHVRPEPLAGAAWGTVHWATGQAAP